MNWFNLLFIYLAIITVFYYVDMQPMLINISDALHAEIQLQREIFLKKQSYKSKKNVTSPKINTIVVTRAELINYLVGKVNDSGFVLEEFYPIKIFSTDHLSIASFKLIASGEFVQLKKLIDQLCDGYFMTNIDEIVMHHIVNKSVRVLMTVDVFNVNTSKQNIYSKNDLTFQWIGYMKKNDNIIGLLRMNNGDVREVSAGSVIDKTSIKVLKLDTEKMFIQSGNRVRVVNYGKAL